MNFMCGYLLCSSVADTGVGALADVAVWAIRAFFIAVSRSVNVRREVNMKKKSYAKQKVYLHTRIVFHRSRCGCANHRAERPARASAGCDLRPNASECSRGDAQAGGRQGR